MSRPGSRGGVQRPGSAARIGTASGTRPPGTASRLASGMAPGTASGRGAVTGGGVALTAQVKVSDRPMTQQGLTGVKTQNRGPQRQVQDKTYFLGLLRSKINDLSAEIGRLRKEADAQSEDQSSYVQYEKRAEQLASEIKDFQGELGDYNTLVDKLNTDESIADIQMDYEDMRTHNDRESKALELLFDEKKEKEDAIRSVEVELQQEKSMTDNLVAHMEDEMRLKYRKLKETNDHLLRRQEDCQQELDALNMKKTELEEELQMSPVKQEAVRLYEQLHELEEKRDQLLEEQQSRGTPQEERDKLLKRVKEDNQEIASMDRTTNEIRDRITNLTDDIRQMDIDLEENQGERNQKYRELKKREETMNDFLDHYEENRAAEHIRKTENEQNVVSILEHMSRNLGRFHHLPSSNELSSMKDDLNFKEGEMGKSKSTASGLAGESEKLAQDLEKVEQLESKISSELQLLKDRINTMTEEIDIYSDLDKLKNDGEEKKRKLGEDKVTLYQRKEMFKKQVQQITAQYESLKAQLNDNETHAQLANLERKWQHHEQNNFVMKEYIATKMMESDFQSLSKKVTRTIQEYNQLLHEQGSGSAGAY